MTINFTNKTEYLAWRSLWRADYADLSKRIRDWKAGRKSKDAAERSLAQCHCALRRKEATAMLELRKKSKVLAGQQRQAAMPQAA